MVAHLRRKLAPLAEELEAAHVQIDELKARVSELERQLAFVQDVADHLEAQLQSKGSNELPVPQ